MTQYRNQITIFVCVALTAGVFTAVAGVSSETGKRAAGTATCLLYTSDAADE